MALRTIRYGLLWGSAAWLLCPAMARPSDNPGQRVQTVVYRCEDPQLGSLVFQAQPCHPAQTSQRLQLTHHEPTQPGPNLSATDQLKPAEKSRRNSSKPGGERPQTRPTRPQHSAPGNFNTSRQRKSRRARALAARSLCPATRESGGPTGSKSVRVAWERHSALPSRTYLKNAGKWPAHCPD